MAEFETVALAPSKPFTSYPPDRHWLSFPEDSMLLAHEVGVMFASPVSRISVDYTLDVFLAEKFRGLADRWRAETRYISSLSEIEEHETFQEIVEMGQSVIPLVLQELSEKPSWLLLALDALVEEPPILEASEGGLLDSANAWIEWGKKIGYL